VSVGACTGCAILSEVCVDSDLGKVLQLLIVAEGAPVGELRDARRKVVLTCGCADFLAMKLAEAV
jgi:hypothetical protein